MTLAVLFGEEKPKIQPNVSEAAKTEYTKALVDLATAQSNKLNLIEQIEKAKKENEDQLAKANAAVQAALQKAATDCGEKSNVDGKALSEKGVLACVPKEAK